MAFRARLLFSAMLAAPLPAQAASLQTLYSFGSLPGAADGAAPSGTLLIGQNGVLYGVAAAGGSASCGTQTGCGAIIAFNPTSHAESVVHALDGTSEGSAPNAGLIQDASGILYGTANQGGSGGAGTVFQIDPATGILTVLHSFSGGADGAYPAGGLLRGIDGALYGTTEYGGADGAGSVFRLDPASNTLTTIYSFTGNSDGGIPIGGLVQTRDGLFYGTTAYGGADAAGTLFKLDPASGTLTTLHVFTGGKDGGFPYDTLTLGSTQTLFGTTRLGGGSKNAGTVFSLALGSLKFITLHSFKTIDGANPLGGVVLDAQGLLVGATSAGGHKGAGTVFQLDPATRTLTTLHGFTGGADGSEPAFGNLAVAASGLIYGTAGAGGANGAGTLFKLRE